MTNSQVECLRDLIPRENLVLSVKLEPTQIQFLFLYLELKKMEICRQVKYILLLPY